MGRVGALLNLLVQTDVVDGESRHLCEMLREGEVVKVVRAPVVDREQGDRAQRAPARHRGNADAPLGERRLAGLDDLHHGCPRLRPGRGRRRIDVAAGHRRADCAALFVDQIDDAPVGETVDGELRRSSQSSLAVE